MTGAATTGATTGAATTGAATAKPPPRRRRRLSRPWRLAARLAAGGLAALALAAAGLALAVHAVDYPVDALSPDRGGPLVITDRRGQVLRSVPSPDGRPGRTGWVTLDRVPSPALLAVIASEDHGFFDHGGVDARGVARALWLDLRRRRLAYGGSTITMQLVRMVRGRAERTLRAKLVEAVLAMRLERALTKREILEQYLNRAYYGNGAHGIEAAARLYFDKPAAALGPGEATLLAVIPRAPTRYDPIRNLDAALRRREHVLGLLARRGLMTPDDIDRARRQPLAPALHPPAFAAPHFVDWVRSQISPEVRARGGRVTTTLDLDLQRRLEADVAAHVAALSERGLRQAGLVVLDTRTGAVRAMIGSPDFAADGGQINITTWRRHPGSALKPFVYALAIEAGDHPATIALDIHDVPSAYRLTQVTQPERGPVRYREALAGSYNLAAVHVLEKVGTERLMSVLRRAGAGPVDGTPGDYSLRLALGSARVRLLDLAAAYGFLARGGAVTRPRGIASVVSDGGRRWSPPRARPTRVFSPETSWLVMDMLADPVARRPVFGHDLPVDLPFPVAAKTGTSRGFADTIAVGVTSEYTVAAWAGNFDGSPTRGLIAMHSAAPLVRAGLLQASGGRTLTLPPPPDTIEAADVCPLSGMSPSPSCPGRMRERFVRGHVPRAPCTWHRADGTIDYPAEARQWAHERRAAGGRLLGAAGHAP